MSGDAPGGDVSLSFWRVGPPGSNRDIRVAEIRAAIDEADALGLPYESALRALVDALRVALEYGRPPDRAGILLVDGLAK